MLRQQLACHMSRILGKQSISMNRPSNFCFPVRELADDSVKLIPFTLNHCSVIFEAFKTHPDMHAHLGSGPYDSVAEFETAFLERSFRDPSMFTYAVVGSHSTGGTPDHLKRVQSGEIEKSSEEEAVVGTVSITHGDPVNRCANIGVIQVLPSYRGRGIAYRVGKLLLRHGMTSPEEGGLGLVRMEWRSSTANTASIKIAERLGLKRCGVVEYERLLMGGVAKGKIGNGRPSPPGTADTDLWRDVVVYSVSWNDWKDTEHSWVGKLQ